MATSIVLKKYPLIFFLLVPVLVFSQNLIRNNIYQAGLSTYLTSGSQAPFWLHSNQYGEVPFEGNVIQGMLSVHHEYDSTYSADKKLNRMAMGYGLRAVGNLGRVNDMRLTEAYLKGRAGPFELFVGRRREIIGLVDTTLSSGSYIWSGNALPLPKVQLSIPEYTPIFKNEVLSIKGTYAHGWFGSTDSVQNYYLHQKTFYARLGKPKWRMKFYAGFNHQVQWGGKPSIPFYDAKTDQIITSYPSDFATYIKVVSGVSLNKNLDAGDIKDGVPFNEAFNRAGNHLGTIDIALDFKTRIGTFMLYRQSIYEDGSLFYLNNISDGLQGLSFKNDRFGIGLEYLDTRNQGGSNGADGPAGVVNELRGRDNYFNNSVYEDGYTYLSRGIGTPFLMPFYQFSTDESSPTKLNSNYFYHNRMQAFHLGVHYSFSLFKPELKYSLMKSSGSYGAEQSLINHSVLMKLDYNRNMFLYRLCLSADSGEFWRNQFGLQASIQRLFNY